MRSEAIRMYLIIQPSCIKFQETFGALNIGQLFFLETSIYNASVRVLQHYKFQLIQLSKGTEEEFKKNYCGTEKAHQNNILKSVNLSKIKVT